MTRTRSERQIAGQGKTPPLEAMSRYVQSQPAGTRFCVAFSGGLDSTVLLYLAASVMAERMPEQRLRAIHIDHGLQASSPGWARCCTAVAASLEVPISVESVQVIDGPQGPEGQARLARYTAFARLMSPDEHLLLAQHADDLAETFVLQALRGAGPDGLASIPWRRAFGPGQLVRPLLGCTRVQLQELARHWQLCWVEDRSNTDQRFDRNFLRHEIMPRLRERWPSAAYTLGRAAHRSAAASQTLMALAEQDLTLVRVREANALSVTGLRLLGRERLYNALRLWVRQQGFRMPRLQDLVQVRTSLLVAREDAQPLVDVREYQFRRHRDRLYVMRPPVPPGVFEHLWAPPFDTLLVPETGQRLTRAEAVKQGVPLTHDQPLRVRSRRGGETIELGDPPYHKAVKKLLQEAAVPPWLRDAVPLLYQNQRLVAIWGLAVASRASRRADSPSFGHPDSSH